MGFAYNYLQIYQILGNKNFRVFIWITSWVNSEVALGKILFRNMCYCRGKPDLRVSWVTQNVIAFHIYLGPKIFTVPLTLVSMIRTGITGQLGGAHPCRRPGYLSGLPLCPGRMCSRLRLHFGKVSALGRCLDLQLQQLGKTALPS